MNSNCLINGVSTPIITFGRDVSDDLSDVNYLVLIITGNPGVIEFYRDFMKILYDQLSENISEQIIPVWGTSHAGHQINYEKLPPNAKHFPDLYKLGGQIAHKMRLIDTYIPKHIKIIGIGHSVGCKIWSEVLRRDDSIESQLFRCYMLFPTLERIQATPNGQRLTPIFRWQTPLFWLIAPFLYLPDLVKMPFIKLFFIFKTSNLPPCIVTGALKLLNSTTLKNSADLAVSEFEQILELDVETLERSLDKFYFYFGTTDGWCPLEYVDDMKRKIPKMNYKICDKGLDHAFVVNGSFKMATILRDLILHSIKGAEN